MLPEILKVFYSITTFQLLFFSLIVLTIKPFKSYQYWLSAFLFIEFLKHLIHVGRWIYYFIPNNHFLLIINFILEYSFCPVFLLFVIKVSGYKVKLNFRKILFLIPYIIGFSFIYVPSELWSKHALLFHIILSINYYGQALFYVFIAYNIYKKYQANMENYVAQNYLQQLNWLKLIIVVFMVLWFLGFLFNFLELFILVSYSNSNIVIELTYLIAINIMIFAGASRTKGIRNIIEETSETSNVNNKYAASSLSKTDKEAIVSKVKGTMSENKIYRTPNITLKLLANKLGIQPKHLSQVINEYFNMNFCEYINTLRIEDAIEQLTDPENEHKTILEIIYHTGFNSKSSFNTLFKKQTGLTPTNYKLEYFAKN